MKKRSFLIFIVCCLLSAGCRNYVSPYTLTYIDETRGIDFSASPYFEKSDGFPVVIEISSGNVTEAEIELINDGYIRIGLSSFNAQAQHEYGVTQQAKKVHASRAIWYNQHTHTESKTRTVPHIEFQTDRSGNIIGDKTTYRDETSNTRYFDHGASYWVKVKDSVIRLGVAVKKSHTYSKNSHRGLQIVGIRKNSPASQVGFFRGDILSRIGKISIHDKESLLRALDKYAGKKVSVVFWRDEEKYTRDVKLNRGMTIKEPFSSIIRIR